MVTYQVDFISDDDRIMKPSNVPTPPKVYYGATADAVVGPMTLKAKGTNFGSRPLKFEFVVTWALDKGRYPYDVRKNGGLPDPPSPAPL